MKKLLCVLLAAGLLSSCSTPPGNPETAPTDIPSPETTLSETESPAAAPANAEEMAALDSVLSVTLIPTDWSDSVIAYRVDFEYDGLQRYAEIILPSDYTEISYPTVLYFPDVGYDLRDLSATFAENGINIVRLFSRGSKGNEGVRDFGGKDYGDAEHLLSLLRACDFLSEGGIFTAGAAVGSMYALRLAADYGDNLKGCAVVDPIGDLASLATYRGEQMEAMLFSAFGCTEEELPDEYARRSTITYAAEYRIPLLIFAYEENYLIPMEQAVLLTDTLEDVGCEYEFHRLSPLNSDFIPSTADILLPWIDAQSNQ